MRLCFGLALLFAVAFLTNTGLPAGEIDFEAAATRTDYRFVEYSENTKFDISLEPFSTGNNLLTLAITDLNGKELSDLVGTKIKVSNPSKNITPIEIPTTSDGGNSVFQGEVTFGFSGTWKSRDRGTKKPTSK